MELKEGMIGVFIENKWDRDQYFVYEDVDSFIADWKKELDYNDVTKQTILENLDNENEKQRLIWSLPSAMYIFRYLDYDQFSLRHSYYLAEAYDVHEEILYEEEGYVLVAARGGVLIDSYPAGTDFYIDTPANRKKILDAYYEEALEEAAELEE